MCTRPLDQIIWSSFIYFFFWERPFDQDLGYSLIYFLYLHTTIRQKYRVLFHLFFFLVGNHSAKNYGPHHWFISYICTRPFDKNIWSFFLFNLSFVHGHSIPHSFISFICTRSFDQIIWSSFIYSFFSVRPFDQKLGSSLIYFFRLHTTIRQKYMTFFVSFILSLCTNIWPKIRVLINLLFLFVHNHPT